MKGYIRKRGKESWQIAIPRGRDPKTNEYNYDYYTVRGSKEDADAKRIELLHDIYSQTYVEPSQMTFGAYLDYWLDSVWSTLKVQTREWYKMVIDKYIKPQLRDIKIQKLTAMDIQRYLSNVKRIKGDKPLAPNTIHGHFRLIHDALSQAVEWNILKSNPADKIKRPRKEKNRGQVLPPEDLKKLLTVAKKSRYYELIIATVATGMRQGELLGLRWSDINLTQKIIFVQQTLAKGGKSPEFNPAKTESSQEAISIPKILIPHLYRQKEKVEREKAQTGFEYQDYGLVFATQNGTPIQRSNLDRWFKSILKQAGLDTSLRFHDLRHSHATWLLLQGVDLVTVSKQLRHSSVSTTGDIYAHVLNAMRTKANGVLDEVIGNALDALED